MYGISQLIITKLCCEVGIIKQIMGFEKQIRGRSTNTRICERHEPRQRYTNGIRNRQTLGFMVFTNDVDIINHLGRLQSGRLEWNQAS